MGRALTNDGAQLAARAVDALHRGQQFEARREPTIALACYEEAISAIRILPSSDPELRRLHGIVEMNRGNALQKLASPASLPDAVRAYDEAIAQFETLPHESSPPLRNTLGAAWLNRGHALLASGDGVGATASFERAVAMLEGLPLDSDISYRLNLAGARTNLAHVLIGVDPARARLLAQEAHSILAGHERQHLAFAEMSLRTSRALVMANGELLRHSANQHDLATEATDAIDEGLALARELETNGVPHLRPLALRLFCLGAQLYRVHQPHFLAEFLLENFSCPAFAGDTDFRNAADEAVALALAETQRPRKLVVGDAAAERLLETTRSLRAAQDHLSSLVPVLSTHAV